MKQDAIITKQEHFCTYCFVIELIKLENILIYSDLFSCKILHSIMTSLGSDCTRCCISLWTILQMYIQKNVHWSN